MPARHPVKRVLVTLILIASVLLPVGPAHAAVPVLPAGFQDQIVWSGLQYPTNIEFAPDGRIFVTEKRGVIKVFDSIGDQTPDIFADLSDEVHDQGDRGLIGLALPPDFPTNPWVYVLYAYDAPRGQPWPRTERGRHRTIRSFFAKKPERRMSGRHRGV